MSKRTLAEILVGIISIIGFGFLLFFSNKQSKLIGYEKGKSTGFDEGYDKAAEVYLKAREM